MKRRITILLASALLASVVTGCFNTDELEPIKEEQKGNKIYFTENGLEEIAQAVTKTTATTSATLVSDGFQCSKVDDDSIQGPFNYFGNIENNELLNSAYILFIDTSGGKYLFVTDITGYLNKKNPNANIEIHLEFDVPEPSVGGAGVQPTVDDWNDIWYKYQLG